MSADRPSELWGCGAPQTIEQEGIFGGFARSVPRLSEPSSNMDRLQALLRKGEQAIAMSLEGRPGPVHINVPLPKPLSPLDPTSNEEREFALMVERLCGETSSRFLISNTLASRDTRRLFLERLTAGTDPLLVTLGPTDKKTADLTRTLATLLDAPLVS
jgi:2-succinyl-5-enolpyruvyl-6-hydroxy-3-cyclohexene-1-carboxylate synthase